MRHADRRQVADSQEEMPTADVIGMVMYSIVRTVTQDSAKLSSEREQMLLLKTYVEKICSQSASFIIE